LVSLLCVNDQLAEQTTKKMTTIFKKTVDNLYSFLLADAAGEFAASFRYKVLFVSLAIALCSSAAYAMLFMQS